MKMKVIVLVVLAAASFGGSYLVFKLFAPAPPPAAIASTQPAEEEASTAPASMPVTASMKQRELEELIREVRQRLDDCKKRQAELDKQEKRIRVASDEIKKQAEEVEALRVELVAPLTKMREALAELEKTRIRNAAGEQANIKKIALVCEKMDAANGGAMLARMCSNNQEDDAVKILHFMSERSAGKMLSEMTDKEMAARLCTKLKQVAEEAAPNG